MIDVRMYKTYETTKTTILLDTGKSKISLRNGVRQGDTTSPEFFNAFFENIFKKWIGKTKGLE